MTVKLSVVMPCHNRREALALTLESLARQSFPASEFEVIVVDQASTDGSRELVRSLEVPYRLRLVEQDAKYGISVARNAGADAASAAIVLFLDADLVAHPDLVAEHVRYHQAWDRPVVAGRILPYPPACTSFLDRCANPEGALDRGDREGPLPVYQAFGGNLSFDRQVCLQLGGFDERLRGAEDTDLAYRAQQMGCPVISGARAIAYHNHPRTLEERCAQALAYMPMVPLLLAKHPELRGQIADLRDLEPIVWRRDGPATVLRKLRMRFLGLSVVRGGLYAVLRVLIAGQRWPRLISALYWRLLAGCNAAGYREGLRRYGW